MTQSSSEFVALQTTLAGEYSLQRELGRGGMGVVYLARDVQLDRDVAIKVLPAHLSSADTRERFLREARIAAGLSHPHIVPIHRVGEAGGFVFFVMSFVEGATLGEHLRTHGPLGPADATRVMREVAWALAYAHGRGVVHRDIKPDNILLEAGTGRALVTDFGIAHGGARYDDAPAEPGKIMGTANFMSPEQAAGEFVDGRGDIYSLGVVGYVAVSGRLPFESGNLPALLLQQATNPAPPVLLSAPGLPSSLAHAIDRCLERDASLRFADGEEIAAALAPVPDARPLLSPSLRAWITARNPLLVPYMAWSAALSVMTLGNVYANVIGNPGSSPKDVVFLGLMTTLPAFPIIGFHLNQAHRQFRIGHTLNDLRSAIGIAQRERAESEALTYDEGESGGRRILRNATVASATWLAVTAGLILSGVIHERSVHFAWFVGPVFSTMLLGAISNALEVQFIPERVRDWWQTGIRERLWTSRAGEWLSRKIGAPAQSAAVGGGVFRPTEVVLGLAAAELYSALPQSYREQLSDLPGTVAALEARAAAARVELDETGVLASSASAGAEVLKDRRAKASLHLSETVAALESIRLDLLRLHAGAGDMKPLTTLIDAARLLGDDMNRLAIAKREVEVAVLAARSAGHRDER